MTFKGTDTIQAMLGELMLADGVDGVFTEVNSGMDPMEFFLVEVAVGVHFELLFLFCLADVMVRFYLLK